MRKLFALCILIASVYATCTTHTVVSGDSCSAIYTDCGITAAEFADYNPSVVCTDLQVGERVCCSSGGLSPPENSNGTCATYYVQSGDTCTSIGEYYGLTVTQIGDYNTETWGWLGCADLQLGMAICLSSGTPPIPTSNSLSACGMTAPGSLFNSSCPLNACCSQWGFCGVTSDFCATTTSATNNPGTVGCQSNCGMDYIATSGPPSEFIKIGYWEEFQWERPCLNLDGAGLQNMINEYDYTEIHYSFGIICNYEVCIQNMTTFYEFLNITGVKKVVTFGGWAFSTDDSTLHIFGEAVQQETFVNSAVEFINTYDLDGIEIDWEYPGATDLWGWAGSTPTQYPDDGTNYLNMLIMMKAALPTGKSLSIAAPSSFWYLQNFPIAEMSNYLDYVMMMTYDLHGQWDYNIASTGPYLMSHVNETETIQSLTMITKAGVPSNKIVMGVASYARGFQQADPSCYTPDCLFTGPNSGATPGECTQTPGYIGFGELQQIIDNGTVRMQYYDEVSGSDILLYNTADWAAYTNVTTTLLDRYTLAQSMNLLGTGEWAVDLRGDVEDTDEEIVIYSATFNVTMLPCPTSIDSFSDAAAIASQCGYQAAAAALVVAAQTALNTYNSIMAGPDCSTACSYDEEDDWCQKECAETNPNFSQLYTLYAGAAESAAYRNIAAYFTSAEYQYDGSGWSTPWNRYTTCSGVACEPGVGFTVDSELMLEDLVAYTNSSYVFNLGTYVFPYSFETTHTITYSNFPTLNTTASFPDPETFLGSGATTAVENAIRLLNAALNDGSTTDAQFQTAVQGAIYIVIPFMQSVDSMGQIINVGNQVLQAQQEEAQSIFISILEVIGLVAVSFIPDVGPALAAAIGIGISVAEGDTNPLDYIMAAVGAFSEIGDLLDDTAESFDAAASKVDEILESDPTTFDYLDKYEPYTEFEDVVEEADASSVEDDLAGCSV
jgi:GH18 family chitinase/LysM repeat protein